MQSLCHYWLSRSLHDLLEMVGPDFGDGPADGVNLLTHPGKFV